MIVVLADDVTGAAEIGGMGLRHGYEPEILTAPDLPWRAEFTVFDTDSRSCSQSEAQARVAQAAEALRHRPPRWVYKKVDSVLRGQVLAELEVMMQSLNMKRVLLVPANPSLGRLIRGGRYFIHGQPVNETDFRTDPHHPVRSSFVLDMLGPGGATPVCVRRPGDTIPQTGVIVGEVGSTEDLHWWAQWLDEKTLPAGGAEFFGCLLGLRARGRSAPVPRRSRTRNRGAQLFVCGSTAAAAAEFLKNARRMGWPVVPMPAAQATAKGQTKAGRKAWVEKIGAAFERSERVVAAIELPLVTDPLVAVRLSQALVEAAVEVVAQRKPNGVYVEGGATAAFFIRRMGWQRLPVVEELAQGVVTMAMRGSTPLRFTIKPGSYSWPESIWKRA